MLPIAAARTDKKSDCIESLPGDAGEDNVAWLQRAAGKVAANFGQRQASSGHIRLVLLGGTDPVSFRLRVAQAHVRHDLTPSSWSHVVLCDPREAASVHEISPRAAGRVSVSGSEQWIATGDHRGLPRSRPVPEHRVDRHPQHREAHLGEDRRDVQAVSETTDRARWDRADRAVAGLCLGSRARRQSSAGRLRHSLGRHVGGGVQRARI